MALLPGHLEKPVPGYAPGFAMRTHRKFPRSYPAVDGSSIRSEQLGGLFDSQPERPFLPAAPGEILRKFLIGHKNKPPWEKYL